MSEINSHPPALLAGGPEKALIDFSGILRDLVYIASPLIIPGNQELALTVLNSGERNMEQIESISLAPLAARGHVSPAFIEVDDGGCRAKRRDGILGDFSAF